MRNEKPCKECGAVSAEHRWSGEFLLHPGFADTWERHCEVAASLTTDEAKREYLHVRQKLLREQGRIA